MMIQFSLSLSQIEIEATNSTLLFLLSYKIEWDCDFFPQCSSLIASQFDESHSRNTPVFFILKTRWHSEWNTGKTLQIIQCRDREKKVVYRFVHGIGQCFLRARLHIQLRSKNFNVLWIFFFLLSRLLSHSARNAHSQRHIGVHTWKVEQLISVHRSTAAQLNVRAAQTFPHIIISYIIHVYTLPTIQRLKRQKIVRKKTHFNPPNPYGTHSDSIRKPFDTRKWEKSAEFSIKCTCSGRQFFSARLLIIYG